MQKSTSQVGCAQTLGTKASDLHLFVNNPHLCDNKPALHYFSSGILYAAVDLPMPASF